ncbi:hypothetical protein GCM10023091_00460 [Ravibacter arvi]|uniref:Lanthionine synthetase-like protein n=1 Tax=Ravibacter arvi TaxID=2051041 RepID=A0ABP8LM49_9BACT
MDFYLTKYLSIVRSMLLNAHSIDNIGLLHGKMGVAIQFYHLTRKTTNPAFEIVAGELVDDVVSHLSSNTSIDFESGLAGIGWGIEYLLHNCFLEAENSDEILEEMDEQIFKFFLQNTPREVGLLDGVVGPGVYFLNRIKNSLVNSTSSIFKTNRIALQQICNHVSLILPEMLHALREPRRVPDDSVEMQNFRITDLVKFDITWTLPVLIVFLAKVIELDINVSENIFVMLLDECITCEPVLQCNKLLLLLALEELKSGIQSAKNLNIFLLNQKIVVSRFSLLNNLNEEEYRDELNKLDFSLRNGVPGIAIVIFCLERRIENIAFFKKYMEYAKKYIDLNLVERIDLECINVFSKSNMKKFGILEGVAGLLLFVFFDSDVIFDSND